MFRYKQKEKVVLCNTENAESFHSGRWNTAAYSTLAFPLDGSCSCLLDNVF